MNQSHRNLGTEDKTAYCPYRSSPINELCKQCPYLGKGPFAYLDCGVFKRLSSAKISYMMQNENLVGC